MEKEQIEQLRKEFNERIDALLKEETKENKFEVGKWYKDSLMKVFMFTHKDQYFCHGKLADGGDYSEATYATVPVTDKEVEDALKIEKDKKGLVDGKWVFCLKTNRKQKIGDVFWVDRDGSFWTNGYTHNACIMMNGKWAEIIKEEKIMIGGYEMKMTKLGDFQVGCKTFSLGQIQALSRLMENSGFKRVAFDGTEVTLETINKILNL